MDWFENALPISEIPHDKYYEAYWKSPATRMHLSVAEGFNNELYWDAPETVCSVEFGPCPSKVLVNVDRLDDAQYMQYVYATHHFVKVYDMVGRAESKCGYWFGQQTWQYEKIKCSPFQLTAIIKAWSEYSGYCAEFDRMRKYAQEYYDFKYYGATTTENGDPVEEHRPYYYSRLERFREMVIYAYERLYPARGWIYLIPEPIHGYHKIGKAQNPDDRIGTFEVKLPFIVKTKHLIRCTNRHKLEIALHSHYKHKRVDGEWFALSDFDVQNLMKLDYVDDIKEAIDTLPQSEFEDITFCLASAD